MDPQKYPSEEIPRNVPMKYVLDEGLMVMAADADGIDLPPLNER